MSLPVFPVLPGLTYTSIKTPGFKTLVASAPSGYESRVAQVLNPVWEWQLVFDFLHDFFWSSFTTVSELRTLMGFFNAQSGQAASFLYTDPDDNYVGPALVSAAPNTPLAQLQVVNDGAGNYYSPIQRTLDGVFYEDITDLNGSIVVYANGSLASVGAGSGQYEVMGPGLAIPGSSFMGMYLKWGSSPATPVTAQFNFYFRVRFGTDSQDFEKFLATGAAAGQRPNITENCGYWTIGGSESQNGASVLKLRTARPNPA